MSEINAEAAPRKLRILCLHGFNNNVAVMRWQLSNFVAAFDTIC